MALADICEQLRVAERAAGRAEDHVKLIGMSKIQPAERVVAVLDQGDSVIGENHVLEAAGKWSARRDRFAQVELHMIGRLQTNKAKVAVDARSTRSTPLTGPRWRRSWPACSRRAGRCRSCSRR